MGGGVGFVFFNCEKCDFRELYDPFCPSAPPHNCTKYDPINHPINHITRTYYFLHPYSNMPAPFNHNDNPHTKLNYEYIVEKKEEVIGETEDYNNLHKNIFERYKTTIEKEYIQMMKNLLKLQNTTKNDKCRLLCYLMLHEIKPHKGIPCI